MIRKVLKTLSKHLTDHHLTLAVAESVTAGYIQFLCSNAPEATSFFQGGITTYNCGQKARHLGVEPIYATEQKGVAPGISQQMARQCCQLFNSHIGIGITGFADRALPDDGTAKAYLSVFLQEGYIIDTLLLTDAASFDAVQEDFARQSLQLLNDFFEHQYKTENYGK